CRGRREYDATCGWHDGRARNDSEVDFSNEIDPSSLPDQGKQGERVRNRRNETEQSEKDLSTPLFFRLICFIRFVPDSPSRPGSDLSRQISGVIQEPVRLPVSPVPSTSGTALRLPFDERLSRENKR